MKQDAQIWNNERLQIIIYTCIIMQNIMVEHEGRDILMYAKHDIINLDQQFILCLIEFLTGIVEIQNAETRQYLQEELA